MNFKRLLISCILLVSAWSLFAHTPVKPSLNTAKVQVIDAGSGEPLTGARVMLNGSTQAILTDSNGFFEIQVDENQQEIITISLVSFQSFSIATSQLVGKSSIQLTEK